jgi:hypothetical protein
MGAWRRTSLALAAMLTEGHKRDCHFYCDPGTRNNLQKTALEV